MKKPTAKSKRLHQIRARSRFRRRFRGAKKFKPVRRRKKVKYWDGKTIRNALVSDEKNIRHLPKVLCFERNPKETLDAFDTTRKKLHQVTSGYWVNPSISLRKTIKMNSYVSFEKVKDISTSAALVLAAEYERKTKYMAGPPGLINLDKWDNEVLYKLFQIGFFERFGYQVSEDYKYFTSNDILTVPFYSGTQSQMQKYDEKLLRLVEHIDPNFELPKDMRVAINSALGEAANNAREHAYIKNHDFKYPHVGLWWASGAASVARRKIVISLYDQGVTIPISYPKLSIFESIKPNLDLFLDVPSSEYKNDAKLIQAAAKYGKSGRVQKKGGLGLPQIKEAIDMCGEGSLMVLSRGGRYLYTKVDGKTSEETEAFDVSVGGTLLEWQIKIPSNP